MRDITVDMIFFLTCVDFPSLSMWHNDAAFNSKPGERIGENYVEWTLSKTAFGTLPCPSPKQQFDWSSV
jgi:hypothetical protein